jgi:hypothetical protein
VRVPAYERLEEKYVGVVYGSGYPIVSSSLKISALYVVFLLPIFKGGLPDNFGTFLRRQGMHRIGFFVALW